jgi:hypothetical protein
MKFLTKRKPELPVNVTPMALGRVGDPIANKAIDLFDDTGLKLNLTEPNTHGPEPIVPLVGQTVTCILNELLPLLPGDGRVITFKSKQAGDTLYEHLRITYGMVTIRVKSIGAYVHWDVEFDEDKKPSAADADVVALALANRISEKILAVVDSHAGINSGRPH